MNNKGFTLIEVVIVVAILAILAALAIPSYGRYMGRGQITAAQSDLILLSLRYENRYQRVLSYPAADLQTTAQLQAVVGSWAPASDAAHFTFASVGASSSDYTLRAIGVGGHAAGCIISLAKDGAKSIAGCAKLAPDGEWL